MNEQRLAEWTRSCQTFANASIRERLPTHFADSESDGIACTLESSVSSLNLEAEETRKINSLNSVEPILLYIQLPADEIS
jgi:hypothetical protein